MIRIRYCKIALVASVALFATLVAFNNITDYGANFKFVQHVLMMDTIFPDSRQTWRAVGSPLLHHAVYIAIILLQVMIAFLCWAGAVVLLKTVHEDATAFERAKGTAIVGLTLGFFLWFLGLIGIGGEWYLMWQSEQWNAQQSAFRMAMLIGVVLLCLFFTIPSSALPRRGPGTRTLHQRSGRQAEVREDLGNHGGMFDACPTRSWTVWACASTNLPPPCTSGSP